MKQDKEGGSRRKREPFFILSVVAATVAGLLLLDMAVPLLPRGAITSLFTGGKDGNISPSGEAVTRPVSLWEQVFGEYRPGHDSLERPTEADTADSYEPWLTTPTVDREPSWVWPEPGTEYTPPTQIDPMPVTYIDQDRVAEWQHDITNGLMHLEKQKKRANFDTYVGIFDFDLDGKPEIVLSELDEYSRSFVCTIYGTNGKAYSVIAGGDGLPRLLVYSREYGVHPCMTGYFLDQHIFPEDGLSYSAEMMYRFVGKDYIEAMYGMEQSGDEVRFFVNNGEQVDKDVWYDAMEKFDMQYDELPETEMEWFLWDGYGSSEELATAMVNSGQRFVHSILYGGETYNGFAYYDEEANPYGIDFHNAVWD